MYCALCSTTGKIIYASTEPVMDYILKHSKDHFSEARRYIVEKISATPVMRNLAPPICEPSSSPLGAPHKRILTPTILKDT
jgi:hypothetical protein